ncbi:putative adenylate cyclase [Candidatus Methanoperedens nitroreducens]|uniref:Putative adenylate cyclase n=1 Tax=Candidatus Methanoperedens nitratireducens TaxID=1392998 RepID=A0A062VC40_9EURY|nr:class IV adenylate cyclase [Candidatus Methanoperedens nitroreducens]KCZ73274.1 putative adenylate cyclase [Candidatus Methanoperedens nitroreducens]MDJ1422778.1 class IV adenylate cyclase [Candidatus Methanoperedens sp.]
MIEVEVKARVEDPKRIERSIIELGAVPIGIENQADTYYNAPFRDFWVTDEALRIRSQGSKYFLTYKGPKMDSVSKTRKEFEVEVNDAGNMGNILSSLGFSPVTTIVKKRKIYRLGNYFIALDNVRNLGDFIEVEASINDSRNYEEEVETIFKLIEKLGISRVSTVRESYLEMLLKKNKKGIVGL